MESADDKLDEQGDTEITKGMDDNGMNDSTVQPDVAETPKSNRKRSIISAKEYRSRPVGGIYVLLPQNLTLYSNQTLILARLIQSFKEKANALIESPTGTGKTLALLAASCAWLQDYKAQQCPKHRSDHGKIQKSDSTEDQSERECQCNEIKKIRIYYATRTHQQISQVIKEYRRLPYGLEDSDGGKLQHTILASRDNICLDDKVLRSKDSRRACKKLTNKGGCCYYNDLSIIDNSATLREKIGKVMERDDNIHDIEDITKALKKLEICPYYASRRLLYNDADVIFTPYNYLLYPIIRNSTQINLEHAIVILDEAHNVEDECRKAASFDFKESEIHNALKHFDIKLGKLREKFDNTEQEEVLSMLREVLNRLLSFFVKLVPEMQPTVDTKTWNLDAFLIKLKHENLYFEQDDFFKQCWIDFDRITISRLKDVPADKYLNLPEEATSVIQKFLYFMRYFQVKANQQSYKCNVTFERHVNRMSSVSSEIDDEDSSENEDVKDDKSDIVEQPKSFRLCYEATLSFWCMSPSIAFVDAFENSHSVILASGTLSPVETLKTELGLKFKYEMSGKQLIPKEQIFARIVSKGCGDSPFKFTFENMQKHPTLYTELLQTIGDVCKTVPKGILVFVSSYHVIGEIHSRMENVDIKKYKKIFYETQSKNVEQIINDYSTAIKDCENNNDFINGAILFAVFRGKISEGTDFPDDLARCVICVGIPYPNTKDELVIQKKSFNDQLLVKQNNAVNNATSPSNKNILSGSDWYICNAYRALNQALGRCLRHRKDWGAILLFDERFFEQLDKSCSATKKISQWVIDCLKCHINHQTLLADLADFINQRLNDTELQPLNKETTFSNVVDNNALAAIPSFSTLTTPTLNRSFVFAKKKNGGLDTV